MYIYIYIYIYIYGQFSKLGSSLDHQKWYGALMASSRFIPFSQRLANSARVIICIIDIYPKS